MTNVTNDQKLTSVATKRTLEWKLKVFPVLIWQFPWHHLSSASWHLKKPQFPPRHSKCRANFIWKLRWLSRREEPSRIWRALGKEFPCDHQNRTCQQRISLTSVPFQAFQVGTYIYMYIYTHVEVHIPTGSVKFQVSYPSYFWGHINWHCWCSHFHRFNSQMLLASLLWIPLVLASSPAPPVNQKLLIFSSQWFFREKPWESPGLTTHPNTAGAGATCNFTKGTRASPAPWSESKMLKIGSQSLVKQRQICKKKCDESNCTTNIMVQWKKLDVSNISLFLSFSRWFSTEPWWWEKAYCMWFSGFFVA